MLVKRKLGLYRIDREVKPLCRRHLIFIAALTLPKPQVILYIAIEKAFVFRTKEYLIGPRIGTCGLGIAFPPGT